MAALDHLHDTRPEIVTDDTLLARLSPVSHAHINPLGRYQGVQPSRSRPSVRPAGVT